MRKKLLTLFIVLFSIGTVASQSVTGVVKDAQSGEGIVGADIFIKSDSTKGTSTDLKGEFTIGVDKLPTTLIFYFMGYQTQEVTVDGSKAIEVVLKHEALNIDKVTVVGRRKTSSEVAAITGVRHANAVLSAISGAQIAKTSDSDAAEAVKRIPGISLIDNRFIVVRGLSQRYNNVWINNGGVPSSEADGRAFSFDMIPSGNIDNLTIAKSYSADLPGDFCGGFIKIATKGMPDSSMFQIGLGTGFNTRSQFRNMRLSSGSSTDWLGFDRNKRPLSSGFPSNLGQITDNVQLDRLIKNGFNNDWNIKTSRATPDMRLNVLWNARISERLGMILSAGYSNTDRILNDVINKRYGVYNSSTDAPSTEKDYRDNQYTNDVKINAMNNWIWEVSPSDRLEFRNLFNIIARNRLTERYGLSTVSGEYYENQTEMLYSSRLTYTGQLAGTHTIGNNASGNIDWNASYSYASKDEPDRRIVKNIGNIPSDRVIHAALPSYNDQITRYHQTLDDHIFSAATNYKKQFLNRSIEATLRAGLYGEYRTRNYTPREFTYRYDRLSYDQRNEYIYLPFQQMMEPQWLGIDKVYIDETSRKSNAYNGDYSVGAAYVSTLLPLGNFNIDLGIRAEMWNMSIQYDRSLSPSSVLITKHRYHQLSLLPALNIAYNLNKTQLVRFSYGRTVNRPEFREVSPAVYYDFDLFAEVQGNPQLKMATIDNLDLRYELYPSRGEMITIGAFYKRFVNPIEWNFIDMGGSYRYSYENAKSAYTAGIEVDIRKSLDFIGVPQLSLVFNGALVASKVKFSDDGLVKEKDRSLQGQSPYMINTGLYYASGDKLGLSVALLYNIIGKRIIGVGKSTSIDGNSDFDVPDAYEMPRNMLDLTITKRFSRRFDLKLGIKDLLSEPVVLKQFPTATINGKTEKREQITRRYRPGTSLSLALSVKF